MSAIATVVDRFAAEYGATAHGGLCTVCDTILATFSQSLEDQVAAGTRASDALHVATMAALWQLSGAIGDDFEARVATATALGAIRSTLDRLAK